MILLARPARRRAGGLSATASLGSTDKPTPPTFSTTCCTPYAQLLTSRVEACFGSLLRPTDAASLILRLPSDHGADDGRTRLWALWLLVKYVARTGHVTEWTLRSSPRTVGLAVWLFMPEFVDVWRHPMPESKPARSFRSGPVAI